mmetsp:Transcript_38772/g.45149  ORF Transcript_38772/g.45149 Transcript_38772/m.45149 type:complete len:392 (+) Transcript_38772:62-1237(+)
MSPLKNLCELMARQAHIIQANNTCSDTSNSVVSTDSTETTCTITNCDAKSYQDATSVKVLPSGECECEKDTLNERKHLATFGSSLSPAAEAELNTRQNFQLYARNGTGDKNASFKENIGYTRKLLRVGEPENEICIPKRRSKQAKKTRKSRNASNKSFTDRCNPDAKVTASSKFYLKKDPRRKKKLRLTKSLSQRKEQDTAPKRIETNITDFITSIGEESGKKLTTEEIAKFMDRDFLRLSARWSFNIGKNTESKQDSDETHHSLGPKMDKISRSLCADCARDEVEGLSVLLSIESSGKSKNVNCWDEFDNESLEEEINCLGQIQDNLNTRLLRCDKIINDSLFRKCEAEIGSCCSVKSFGPHRGGRQRTERQLVALHRSTSLYTLCGLAQ